MPKKVDLPSFKKIEGIIIDVRSPAEFIQGHIPDSISIPLFDDIERAQVGTVYKKEGQDAAIALGLKIAGPKLFSIIERIRQHYAEGFCKVLCWRGGMRSGFICSVLNSIAIPSVTLEKGYKNYRRYILKTLEQIPESSPKIQILGGYTGTGKTEILRNLSSSTDQFLDLENLASHRGSAFGSIHMPPQPSNEQFENDLAEAWVKLDGNKTIWIEDESRMIGKCHIPNTLYRLMQDAPMTCIKRPLRERLQRLLSIYGAENQIELIKATENIRKKLGGQLTQDIIELLKQNKTETAFTKLLSYYDKAYHHQMNKRKHYHELYYENLSNQEWSKQLLSVTRLENVTL